MLPLFAALMTVAGLALAGLAVYVGRRRGSRAGVPLAAVLISVAWWGLAYAAELSADDLGSKGAWGDLKYVGVCTLAPAWLLFVLQYTGRGHLVTRPVLALLTIEPAAVLALLANRGTHDLVRSYPASAAGQDLPVVETGPAFWFHLIYANLMLLVATAIFVATMVRLSRTYRQMALALVAASLLPWAANLLHNFEVAWFARIDLTPFAFTVTGAVLVWGLWRERLVKLAPLARSLIVDNMTDGVFVIDAFDRIVDVNPSGAAALGVRRSRLVGCSLVDVLEQVGGVESGPDDLTLQVDGAPRTYDVQRRPLLDRGGRSAGELVVLRDITERVRAELRLQHLLDERSRVAAALQTSLTPASLPTIPGLELASRFEPAGDGSEIGGDFFDVFALDQDIWGVFLGDVSGKGAEAAAVTALARYTLRTLAHADHLPSRTLAELNARMLAAITNEMHCTLVYGMLRRRASGVELTLSLAGHHPPLVVRAATGSEPVGHYGTALGLIDDPELYDASVLLAPGDTLCLFTDGLVEARDGAELFGSERAAAVLDECTHRGVGDIDDVAGELVRAARGFHHSDELADDLAILLLRVEPLVVPAYGLPAHSEPAWGSVRRLG
jgi:serine phosphatase RsbU (regulator of sigma subunit)